MNASKHDVHLNIELYRKVLPMTRRVLPCDPHSPPPLLCPGLQPVFLAHENPWFKVISRGSYYTIEFERPQVVVLPVLGGHSIVMVRVKRPLIDDCPLELPAGDSENGETPRDAAMREFSEETGIQIADPSRFIPELPVSEMPNRIPVLLSVFRLDVRMGEFESRAQHDNDIVSVEALSFPDAARKLVEGEIYLSSPVAILSRLLLKEFLGKAIADKEL
jgi:8-oxo-dGTP pyrophosphatase MutT (NUDIX family)